MVDFCSFAGNDLKKWEEMWELFKLTHALHEIRPKTIKDLSQVKYDEICGLMTCPLFIFTLRTGSKTLKDLARSKG